MAGVLASQDEAVVVPGLLQTDLALYRVICFDFDLLSEVDKQHGRKYFGENFLQQIFPSQQGVSKWFRWVWNWSIPHKIRIRRRKSICSYDCGSIWLCKTQICSVLSLGWGLALWFVSRGWMWLLGLLRKEMRRLCREGRARCRWGWEAGGGLWGWGKYRPPFFCLF